MDQSTGRLQLTQHQLTGWVRVLENRAAWTSTRGIQYHFFIAPNKESVYSQFLLDGHRLLDDRPVARLLAAFSELHSGGTLIDYPVEDLRVLSESEPLYPKGDTHWNSIGAFHAYRRWASKVAEQVPLRLFDRDDATLFIRDDATLFIRDDATGDLGSKCDPVRPHELHELIPKQPKAVLVEDNGVHNAGHRRRWRNDDAGGGPKIVVFHDSFFTRMAHFWMETTRELVAVHSPLLEYEVIEDEAPDVVITIMVERFLIRVPDDVFGRTSAEVVRAKASGQTPPGESNLEGMRTMLS